MANGCVWPAASKKTVSAGIPLPSPTENFGVVEKKKKIIIMIIIIIIIIIMIIVIIIIIIIIIIMKMQIVFAT